MKIYLFFLKNAGIFWRVGIFHPQKGGGGIINYLFTNSNKQTAVFFNPIVRKWEEKCRLYVSDALNDMLITWKIKTSS